MVEVLLITKKWKLGTEDWVFCLGTWVVGVPVIKTSEHFLGSVCRVAWWGVP